MFGNPTSIITAGHQLHIIFGLTHVHFTHAEKPQSCIM